MEHTLSNDTMAVSGPLKTPCYLWRWATFSNGYGHFVVGGKNVLAHRWYYEHLVGPIPRGLTLDHLCGNPLCVAPLHLEPVDIQTNSQRGRHTKLDRLKVLSIRSMAKEGKSTKDIAAILGVGRWTVDGVLAKRRWGNIEDA